MKSVADVLNEAAELVARPGGWRQCDYFDSSGACCLIGATAKALGGDDGAWDAIGQVENGPIYSFLVEAIGAAAVWAWNDEPGRTQAEVVAKLREAAALAAQEATHDA